VLFLNFRVLWGWLKDLRFEDIQGLLKCKFFNCEWFDEWIEMIFGLGLSSNLQIKLVSRCRMIIFFGSHRIRITPKIQGFYTEYFNRALK
jgi:hypothetical protein